MGKRRPSPAMELVIVGAAFVALVLVQLTAVDGLWLVSRPLWFDECLTYLIASDASFAHGMNALAGAVDTNTPLLYVLLRAVSWIAPIDIVTLRIVSLGCTTIAAVALYAVLRKSLSRWATGIGVLALWAHPLVIAQAFEARFYAPWLAAAACFAWALSAEGRWRNAFLALSAAALCTVHYFGISALGLMVAAELVRGRIARSLLAVLAGPAALAMCIPLLIRQREMLSVRSWIGPMSGALVGTFFAELLAVPVMVVVVIGIARHLAKTQATADAPRRREVYALVSLLAMPLVLLLLSIVQPALLARYAIVLCLAIAAGAAVTFRGISRGWALGICAVLVLISTHHLRRLAEFQSFATVHVSAIGLAISDQDPQPAVFADGLDMVPVLHAFPALAQRCAFLDDDDSGASDKTRFDREMMHNIAKFYPGVRMISPEEVRRMPAFVFVPSQEHAARAELFDGARTVQINSWVVAVKR